jgi:hypothetical protein
MDGPAEDTADEQDQDHECAETETQIAPPGAFGRCLHALIVGRGRSAVERSKVSVLALFFVRLLREGPQSLSPNKGFLRSTGAEAIFNLTE